MSKSERGCRKKAKVGVTPNGQRFYYCSCGFKEFA